MTLGAGGMLQAGAVGNDSSSPALFVATTPCRLLDTRDAPETVGVRARPLGANDTYTATVIGTAGCALPTDAVTLVMNVTATNQTASSFLTVYGDGTTAARVEPELGHHQRRHRQRGHCERVGGR